MSGALEPLGERLKAKTGNAHDTGFVDAFVTCSPTVCIAAMAIVGSIEDGASGDCATPAVESALDLIIVAASASSMGKGAAFSAIPVGVFEGPITLLARLLEPLKTQLS